MRGRRIRILAVVDDFTCECLSLAGARVACEFDSITAPRSASPLMIVIDNGVELTSLSILRWTRECPVKRDYIARGKPQQTA